MRRYAILAALVVACGDSEAPGDGSTGSQVDTSSGATASTDPTTATSDPGSSSGSGESFAVEGAVIRDATAVLIDDGIGTLTIAGFDVCDADGEPTLLGVLPDADFSAVDTPVPFTIAPVLEGTYFVTAFVDDAPPEDGGPGVGDIVALDLTNDSPACVEVTVQGADAQLADIHLTAVIPP